MSKISLEIMLNYANFGNLKDSLAANNGHIGSCDLEVGQRSLICLFVCLFNWSLHAETRLGPVGTRLEQNAQARL